MVTICETEVVYMESRSREMEAYIDDLRMRMASSLVVSSSIMGVETDQMFPETIMKVVSSRSDCPRFPCPDSGNYVTLSDCWNCMRSDNCDIYATMLDEDFT